MWYARVLEEHPWTVSGALRRCAYIDQLQLTLSDISCGRQKAVRNTRRTLISGSVLCGGCGEWWQVYIALYWLHSQRGRREIN